MWRMNILYMDATEKCESFHLDAIESLHKWWKMHKYSPTKIKHLLPIHGRIRSSNVGLYESMKSEWKQDILDPILFCFKPQLLPLKSELIGHELATGD